VNINTKNSAFQTVILELVRHRLNMMMTEIFQLQSEVDCKDYEKLTKIVLKEIAKGNVHSAHLSTKGARKMIKVLDQLNTHKEYIDKNELNLKKHFSRDNPFSDSPFC